MAASLNAELTAMVEQVCPLQYHHLYGHDGNPINELSDSLCRVLSDSQLVIPNVLCSARLYHTSEAWKWMHLSLMSNSSAQQYHPLFRGDDYINESVVMPTWEAFGTKKLAEKFVQDGSEMTHVQADTNGSMHVVAFNVRSIANTTVRQALLN